MNHWFDDFSVEIVSTPSLLSRGSEYSSDGSEDPDDNPIIIKGADW